MDLSSSARSSTGQSSHPDIALITQTHSNRLGKVEEILQNNPQLQIMTIKDIRLYSLLHIGCLNNQISICKVFFNFLKEQNTPAEEITEWVNSKTDEGFAAIHFASFKGSIELIKLLESYGADIYTQNNRGLNVLHIAAQGDQPVSIAYFVRRGLDLHEKDANGSTPLHWAGYFGMENATYFLTSWGCNPNEKDQEFGCTPLHLAVSSGNIRVVRRLLLKGADKNIRNNEEKNALEVAKENEYEGIVELLQPRSFFVALFNIRPELTNKRTKSSLFLFMFLYTLVAVLNVLFVFPFVLKDIWIILFCAFLGSMLLLFFAVWFKSPGYMQNKKNGDVLKLLLEMKNTPHLVCPDCIIVKPDRSKHCEICNTCVAVYDHHCPWVNNCIGANNYRYFVLFIMSSLTSMIFLLVFSIIHIQANEDTGKYVQLHIKIDVLTKIKTAVCAANFAIILIFMVPLVGLNYLHMGNLIKGKTTVERYGYKANSETMTLSQLAIDSPEGEYQRLRESRQKPKSKGVVKNCISMCCTNASNSKYKYP